MSTPSRIQLEGKLEQVERSIAALKRVADGLRSGELGPSTLESIEEENTRLESLLPELRRHHASKEVSDALALVKPTREMLMKNAARLSRTLELPAPRTVHEVSSVLAPHLPVSFATRLYGPWWQLAAMAVIPAMLGFAARHAPSGVPVFQFVIAVTVVQFVALLASSKRVLVSASSLRLGRLSWPLAELRSVHFQLPGFVRRRGRQVVHVTIETKAGRRTQVQLPNVADRLIEVIRRSGVSVSVDSGSSG